MLKSVEKSSIGPSDHPVLPPVKALSVFTFYGLQREITNKL
jgi:hypothetical protein